MKALFAQKIAGDRKSVMAVIAGITCMPVTYTRAPRFAYEAGGWSIDRDGVLTSPVFPIREAAFHANLVGALGEQDFAAEGTLTVTIFPDGFDPGCLHNIEAILSGKATLIRRALGAQTDPFVQPAEDGFRFPFFPAAATSSAVLAAVQLSALAASQAASQRQVRTKDRPVANEKYAMRCFLLRIGMIGPEYAVARRELLGRLSGDGSFKSGSRRSDAPASAALDAPQRDCLSCAQSMSEPGGADVESDSLFCVER